MQVQFENTPFCLLQKDAAALVPVPYVNQIINKQREQQCWAQEHTCMCLKTPQLLLAVLILGLDQPLDSKLESLHSGAMMSQ